MKRTQVISVIFLTLMIVNVFVFLNNGFNVNQNENNDNNGQSQPVDIPLTTTPPEESQDIDTPKEIDLNQPLQVENLTHSNDDHKDQVKFSELKDQNRVIANSKISGITTTQETESVEVTQDRPDRIADENSFGKWVLWVTSTKTGTETIDQIGSNPNELFPLRDDDGEEIESSFDWDFYGHFNWGICYTALQHLAQYTQDMKIKINDANGQLYWSYDTAVYGNGSWREAGVLTDSYDFTGTTLYVDSDGYLHLRMLVSVNFYCSGSTQQSKVSAAFYAYKIDGGFLQLDSTSSTTTGWNHYDAFRFQVDQMKFVKNPIVSNKRAETIYISEDRFKHSISVENFDYNTNITLKTPLSWEFVSSNPIANYQVLSNNHIFYNTIPITYTFDFVSGAGFGRDYKREKQILAIEDVTGDYFEDPSFDTGGWINDFYAYYDFDSDLNYEMTLNYTQVSHGVSSLRWFGEGYDAILTDSLPSGEFYFSFDYYIESIGADFELQLRDNGSWEYIDVQPSSTAVLDRWNTFFHFFTFQEDSSYDLTFRNDAGTNSTIFLDNFRIYKVNTEVLTTGYSETILQTQFAFFTPYGLYPASYVDASLILFDRTADHFDTSISELDSVRTLTDENGFISWIWKGVFEEKEYELRSIAWDSWFSNYCNYDCLTEEITDWYVGGPGAGGLSITTTTDDVLFGNTALKVSGTSTTTGYLTIWRNDIPNDFNIDFTEIDYFATNLWGKTSGSVDLRDETMFWWGESTSDWIGWQENYDILTERSNPYNLDYQATSYDRFVFDVDYHYTMNGNYELENGYRIYPAEFDIVTSQSIDIRIDGLQLIQAQKFYFTPQVSTEVKYSKAIYGDEFDFSEDIEAVTESGAFSKLERENGYFKGTIENNSAYAKIIFPTNLNIDGSYFDTLRIRAYTNDTTDIIRLTEINYALAGQCTASYISGGLIELTNSWQIYEYTLCGNWITNTDVDDLQLTFYHGDGTTQDTYNGTEVIYVDFVELYHKDSGLEKGLAFEFAENYEKSTTCSLAGDQYYDGWSDCGLTGDREVRNGYYAVDNGILQSYITMRNYNHRFLQNGLDFSDFDYIYIKNKGTSGNTIGFNTPSGYIYADEGINLPSDWEVYHFDLSGISGTVNFLYSMDDVTGDGNVDPGDFFQVDYIRFIKKESPNLVESDFYFVLENEQFVQYNVWIDDVFQGVFSSYDVIQKNMTVGIHTFAYQAFDSTFEYVIYLPGAIYETQYQVYSDQNYDPNIIEQLGLKLGESVYTTTDSYSEQIRSLYRYEGEGVFSNYLPFRIENNGDNVTINVPLDWSDFVIYPETNYTYTSNNLELTNLAKGTYLVLALSGSGFGSDYTRQKQILAISEYKTFTPDKLGQPTNFPMDTLELNNSVLKDGIQSYHIVETPQGQITWSKDSSEKFYLDYGSYYVKFSLYIESWSGTSIDFSYFNNGTWQQQNIDTSILDRWQDYYFFINPTDFSLTGGINRVARFQIYGTADLYITDFDFYKVNTEVITSGYSQRIITSQFNHFTEYGLYPAINEESHFELKDRSNLRTIDTYSDYTDSEGFISWNWLGKLFEKEYEIRSYAQNNYFVSNLNMEYDYFYQQAYWHTGSTVVSSNFDTKEIVVDMDAGGNPVFRADTAAGNVDITYADYIYYDYKLNDTRWTYHYLYTTWSDYFRYSYGSSVPGDTWYSWKFDLKEDFDVENGNPTNTIAFWGFLWDPSPLRHYINDFHFIQTQKYYFTPKTISENFYDEDELLDQWDFSEGDNEGFDQYDGAGGTDTVENGYFLTNITTTNGGNWGSFFHFTGLSVDTDYYDSLRIRIKYENSESGRIDVQDSTGARIIPAIETLTENHWIILDWDLTNSWNGFETELRFIIYHQSDSTPFDLGEKIYWDFIELYHKDSGFESGLSFEFNEPETQTQLSSCLYEDECANGFSMVTTSPYYQVKNGMFIFESDSSWDGGEFNLEKKLTGGVDFTTISLRIRASEPVTQFYFRYSSDYSETWANQHLDTIGTEWEIKNYTIPNGMDFVKFHVIFQSINVTNFNTYVDWVRFYKEDSPAIIENENDLIIENEQYLEYNIWIDKIYQGVYSTTELIPKNLEIGVHTFQYQPFDSSFTFGNYLPGTIYETQYEVYQPANYDPNVIGDETILNIGKTVLVESDSYTDYLRSFYSYQSEGKFLNYLPFSILTNGENMTLKIPGSWSDFIFYPNISYSYSSNNLELTNLAKGNYLLQAYSGVGYGSDYTRQKQILAIDDNTNEYFEDPSFESGWIDWEDSDYSLNLNSNIVSDRGSSLELDHSSTAEIELKNDLFSTGYYYLSFDYYIETPSTYIRLYYSDSESTTAVLKELDLSITERWISEKIYFHGFKSIYYFLNFRSLDSGKFYIDNFKIHKVNTEVITSGYSQTVFESQFNYWTDSGIYPADSEPITLELRDRTANSIIDTKSGNTDSTGYYSWIWKGVFEEKEYELRSTAWESWFGGDNNKLFMETETDSSYLSNSPTTSSDSKVGEFSHSFNGYSWNFDYSSNIDISKADYWYFWIKANTTVTTNQLNYIYAPDYSNRKSFDVYFLFGDLVANTWYERVINIDDLTPIGNPTLTNVDLLRWNYGVGSYLLDGLKLIHSQKYYFTPEMTSELSYGDIWEDEIDFTEGDLEGITDDVYGTTSVERGYMNWSINTGSQYAFIFTGFTGAVENYYTTLKIRIKASVGGESEIYPKDEAGGFFSPGTAIQNLEDDQWNIFEWDLSGNSDFLLDHTWIIDFRWDGSATSPAGFYVLIDWIKVVHQDSNLDKGIVWEFNENNYDDGDWTGASSESISNGYYSAVLGAVANEYISSPKISLNSDNLKLWVEFTTKETDLNILIYAYRLSGGSTTSETLDVQPGTNEYEFDISATGYIYNSLTFRIWQDSGNLAGSEIINFNFIRILNDYTESIEKETETYFVLDNEEDLIWNIWSDNIYLGLYSSYESIPKNLTVGPHVLKYQAIDRTTEYGIFLPGAIYEKSYTIAETGVMKLIYYNQKSKSAPFDDFKTYLDSVRLYDQYVYISDVSQTFNLTITDLFDNLLYQDTTESFEEFKEILFTVYSVKVVNMQPAPIYLYIKKSGLTLSEWVMPYEIAKFNVVGGTYNFTIVYSNVTTNQFTDTITNGTFVTFDYVLAGDAAFQVTSQSIQDVYNNLNNVNATIYYQTTSILAELTQIQGIFRTHFTIIDQLGLGLPFETVLVKVNGTQILDPDQYYENNSLIQVEAFDYFGIQLFNESYNITQIQTINISVILFQMTFRNDGNYTSYITIERNNITGIETSVSPGSEISMRFTSGDYEILVKYYELESQNNTKGVNSNLLDYGSKIYKTTRFSVSAKLPSIVDVSTPIKSDTPETAKDYLKEFWNGFISGMTFFTVGGIFATVLVMQFVREGWVTIKVNVLKKKPEDSLIKPDWLENQEDQFGKKGKPGYNVENYRRRN